MRVIKQLFGFLLVVLFAACGQKNTRPPAITSVGPERPVEVKPLDRPTQPTKPAPEIIEQDEENLSAIEDPHGVFSRSLEELKLDSPLKDIYFGFDSALLSDQSREILEEHARILSHYPGLTILIEGHCDERGTVEYNLALGDRRANAIFHYLITLGTESTRLKTISYGKEFPLDSSSNETAWGNNRRGHFEITGR